MSTVPALTTLPPVSAAQLRDRLEHARGELREVEGRVPATDVGALSKVLMATEFALLTLGWDWPEELTDSDRAVLAAVG